MSLSESRKKKLAMLSRSLAQGDVAGASHLLAQYGHSGVNRGPGAGGRAQPLTLAAACGGRASAVSSRGKRLPYHLVNRKLSQLGHDCLPIAGRYRTVMRGAGQRFDELRASPGLCHAANARPQDPLFMDIETCGLAGASIFLVGTMAYRHGELVFHQYLARDYAEEAAILHAFSRRYAASPLLVTFNGKAFDMTMIRERAAFHGVPLPREEPPHLDLLQEARRLWRGRLPNCRLQTLEQCLCGRSRTDDIPGWAIPEAYHRFVRTGDAGQLAGILHHNLLDLLTMAELLCAVLTGTEADHRL
jgi:uncharacterized protein YprB with RNaseH-like and TPR domain